MDETFSRLLEKHDLAARADRLASLLRNCILLRTLPRESTTELRVGESRIGGSPDLPSTLSWPTNDSGPLAFLAQVDLLATCPHAAAHELPDRGFLWVFYDALNEPWGAELSDAGGWSILYWDGDSSGLQRRDPPAEVSDECSLPACAIVFETANSLPRQLGLSRAEEERYRALLESLEEARTGTHQMLGFANPIQGEMTSELPAEQPTDRTLLLQLESDQNAAMMWGDSGRLYFWVPKEDLKRGQFERAWTILQCY